jgi:membrane protease YdiL (CAAX protease family)
MSEDLPEPPAAPDDEPAPPEEGGEPDRPGPLGVDPVVWVAIAIEGGLVGVAYLAGWVTSQPPLERFALVWRDAAVGAAAALPMLALFFAFLRWPVGPLGTIKKFCDEVLRPILAPCTLLDFAGIALLAGLGEEMLFRGVFQVAFGHWTGSALAGLAIASVLFGVLHAVTATYAVFATLMGAYLGGLFLMTDNLLAAVVAHALYDFVALVILVRRPLAEGERGA